MHSIPISLPRAERFPAIGVFPDDTAEINEGKPLLDGFTFRESYTYINSPERGLASQAILDDTESLYRNSQVYRYDVTGVSGKRPDQDYLHQIIS